MARRWNTPLSPHADARGDPLSPDGRQPAAGWPWVVAVMVVVCLLGAAALPIVKGAARAAAGAAPPDNMADAVFGQLGSFVTNGANLAGTGSTHSFRSA